jgi:hypothetical protein
MVLSSFTIVAGLAGVPPAMTLSLATPQPREENPFK